MSLRARLLIAVVAITAAGLLVADVATYAALRSFLVRRVDQQLQIAHGPILSALVRGDQDIARLVPGYYVEVRASDDTVLATGYLSRPEEGAAKPKLPTHLSAPATTTQFPSPDEPGSYRTVHSVAAGGPQFRVRVSSTRDGGVLAVAVPLTQELSTLHRLVFIEVLVSLLVVAGAAAVGLWLVRLGLKPLDDIATTADAIADGDLARRVDRADDRTEVGRLGSALNGMLSQIEAAFRERRRSEDRLRRFVSDASHELRTPLASIRAYAELFHRGAATRPDDLERSMTSIEREAKRMGLLVDDLLLLARLDEGRPLEHEPVDLTDLAAEALDAAQAVEPDRPLWLVADGAVEVTGDRVRLRQLVDNLLTNVRVHTPARTPAHITVRQVDGRAILDVTDEGPGLGADQAPMVFERFYRADPSRSRDHGGSGLGLSIVAAIAAAHAGRVSARNTDGAPGATFRVDLPAT